MEPLTTLEHVIATVRVPGMHGVSYTIKVDASGLAGGEIAGRAGGRAPDTADLKGLAVARLTAGLAGVFGIRVSPEALAPAVTYPEYDERLFPAIPERDSIFSA